MQDNSSQIVHVVNAHNDEAIAMAALSTMADSIGSSQLAPGTEQLTASTDQICSVQVTGYSEQIGSVMAIDLSSANIDSLT